MKYNRPVTISSRDMQIRKKEIETIADIKLLVDQFYDKLRKDSSLRNVFNTAIKDNWPEHLEKMYGFWETVLFHKIAYQGNPLAHHLNLPIKEEHFKRWITLFTQTLDEYFIGAKASEAKIRAEKIAQLFQFKIKQFHGEL